MATRQRPADRGRERAAYLLADLGKELRHARASAGLSQRVVARAANIDGSQVSRLERSLVPDATVRSYAVLFAVLGLRMTARVFPDGDPLRDAAHARLLARFRALLPTGARLTLEVPLGVPGDPRAWDAELALGGGRCKVEAETALRDLQAMDRRFARKMQDGGVDALLVVVADTTRNRAVLREHRELLRDRYPLDGRAIAASFRKGSCPDRSGIMVL